MKLISRKIVINTLIGLAIILTVLAFKISYNYAYTHANNFEKDLIIPAYDNDFSSSWNMYYTVKDTFLISTLSDSEIADFDLVINPEPNYIYFSIETNDQPVTLYSGSDLDNLEETVTCNSDIVCTYEVDDIDNYYKIEGNGKFKIQLANTSDE